MTTDHPSAPRSASRRTVLTALAAAATAGSPLLAQLATAAPANAAEVEYPSNTALYQQLAGQEGTTFSRRFRRHEQFDTSMTTLAPVRRTAILALHGGGIEIGTSELCLGIAGYSPGDAAGAPVLPTVHDYWMFEGLLSAGNRDLHVTSKNCDDHVALSTAASHLNVLSLHGCTFDQLKLPTATYPPTGDRRMAVVGGLNKTFRTALVQELNAAGFPAIDSLAPAWATLLTEYNGDHVANPCNKTMLGMGAQLELTTELRKSLFDDPDSRGGRASSWNGEFVKFRDACRRAVETVEAGQPLL
ncbi:poly-gamma-glutamate hydrolase family protein [Streptomyces sp. P9(2023)]|uniref:poly-gamma-glutamate hydrolase family protein n=1 Tax=Streptomyces sp. P9(2023) TaxID=3064394 RepID=UPI0028F45FCC|nr:poly-gamma-glutamate hydrolase family protein [Streptomyces sp. P9(2023)]MDT9688503.1 poly-gamma-glutamate hydrolase family protein [Streptomyces sp. P9(2023)]